MPPNESNPKRRVRDARKMVEPLTEERFGRFGSGWHGFYLGRVQLFGQPSIGTDVETGPDHLLPVRQERDILCIRVDQAQGVDPEVNAVAR